MPYADASKRRQYACEYRQANREKRAAYTKRYLQNLTRQQREQRALTAKKWAKENPERRAAIEKKCYSKRRLKVNAYVRGRRRLNENVRLAEVLRRRVRAALNPELKCKSALLLLGCSLADFKIYLESRFQPEMSWENYGNKAGQWSIDHIMPCVIFDLSKLEHQRRCFHFSNMRPMWHTENVKKHARVESNQFNLL